MKTQLWEFFIGVMVVSSLTFYQCGGSDDNYGHLNLTIKRMDTTDLDEGTQGIKLKRAKGTSVTCTHTGDYVAFGAMSKASEVLKYQIPIFSITLGSSIAPAPELEIYKKSTMEEAAIDLAQGAEAISDILTTEFQTFASQALADAEEVVADCSAVSYQSYTANMSQADRERFPDCASFNQFKGTRYDTLNILTEFSNVDGWDTPKPIVVKGSVTYVNGETSITYYTKSNATTAEEFKTPPAEEMTLSAGWFGISQSTFATPIAIGSDISRSIYSVINLTGTLTIEVVSGDGAPESVGEQHQGEENPPCMVVEKGHQLQGTTAIPSSVDLLMCVRPPAFSASIGTPASVRQFLVSDYDFIDIYGYSKLFTTILDSQGKVISTDDKVNMTCQTPVYGIPCANWCPLMTGMESSWTIDENGKYDFIFSYGATVNDFDISITGEQTATGAWTSGVYTENSCDEEKSSGTWIAKRYDE